MNKKSHTPEELLETAEELLSSGKENLYRAAILEAITALESQAQIQVFGSLSTKFDPLFVKWLEEKTKRDFDSRLNPLANVAMGLPVDKSTSLWERYKRSKNIRNEVTHSGTKVSYEDAAFVISTVQEWINYMQLASNIAPFIEDKYLATKFIMAWVNLENILYDSARNIKTYSRQSLQDQFLMPRNQVEILRMFEAENILCGETVTRINKLREIRNCLVHADPVSINSEMITELGSVSDEVKSELKN